MIKNPYKLECEDDWDDEIFVEDEEAGKQNKKEKIDKDVIDPLSDKFDLDIYKTLYREKMSKKAEVLKRQKEAKEARDQVAEELGLKKPQEDRIKENLGYSKTSWLPKEKLEDFKKEYYQIRNRQNEIMDCLIEQKFENRFMKGSYVQEYRQLEARKLTVVDTIMNSFRKDSQNETLWTTQLTMEDSNTRKAMFEDIRY